jgi:hypothetical protein
LYFGFGGLVDGKGFGKADILIENKAKQSKNAKILK